MNDPLHLFKTSIFTLALAFTAPSTWAQCISYTTDGLSYYRAEVPAFSNIGTFNPAAIPLNGVIFTATGPTRFLNSRNPTSDPLVVCSSSAKYHVTGVGIPINNIYPSSIPNIGIRLTANTLNQLVPYIGKDISVSFWIKDFSLKIELIKTGEITAGGSLSGSILQYRAGSDSGQLLVDFQISIPVQITPQVPTCRVSVPTINLRLGNVAFPSSTPVGTTANEQAFNISLNCSGGNSGTATRAYVTLTDVTTPTNRTDRLSLTKESAATGVAIQITRLDTPLKFGQDSAAVGNTNQWFGGSAVFGQGNLDIPLKARYLKTAAQITPGKANGAATFTMSYQ